MYTTYGQSEKKRTTFHELFVIYSNLHPLAFNLLSTICQVSGNSDKRNYWQILKGNLLLLANYAKIVMYFPMMMRERRLCRLPALCLQPNTLAFQIAAKPRMNCWHFLYL
mmetsp:Transcript_18618/g.24059  ORF Transcript_18618/g.24059 Transcript_18618/m.24059 type:complete len:110 (-) Transcript_18618:987-1316(-)